MSLKYSFAKASNSSVTWVVIGISPVFDTVTSYVTISPTLKPYLLVSAFSGASVIRFLVSSYLGVSISLICTGVSAVSALSSSG